MKLAVFAPQDHYNILSDWWTKQEWPIIPKDALPTTGFIAYEGDTPIAAGFLYDTDSTFSIIEWIVGNPDVSYDDRASGLDLVIEGLSTVAKARGKKYIHTFVKHERLMKRYEKFEFKRTDTNMTSMIRSL